VSSRLHSAAGNADALAVVVGVARTGLSVWVLELGDVAV
jgi:hypothetical protein